MTSSLKPFFLNEVVERRYGFARAVQHHGFLFVSGTVSVDQSGQVIGAGCMRTQVETIYAILARILASCGSSPEQVIKETVFATDLDGFLKSATPRLEFYQNGVPPATTGVEVRKLAMPDVLVEIELIAAV